jgi:transmembrane sensor
MRNEQIDAEASDWFVRMRDGDDDLGMRGEFMEWLRRSPEHVSAYFDIAAVWMESRSVDVDSHLELPARIAMAKADRSVVELTPPAAPGSARRFGRRAPLVLAASLALLVAGVGTLWWTFASSVYSTPLGEQRSIALRDGSTIELNADSRIRVRLDDAQRKIELLRGQALFHVAKDASRPFIVQAGGTAVRAVGTVFDVYRKHGDAVVTVVEGTVVVERGNPARDGAGRRGELPRATGTGPHTHQSASGALSLRLTAGKQVVVGRQAAAEPRLVNVTAATAWTRRELVFEFTPLAEAAEEFNRYNERQLIVQGEKLRAFKISAIFRSTDPASLVRYMRNMPGVRIQESTDRVVIAEDGE